MGHAGSLLRYLARLPAGKAVLWCYLVWYLVIAFLYFDPTPTLWLNSLGISALIGTGLILSVGNSARRLPEGWQVFRLYLIPFCVSSFSSLIKGRGFVLLVPPVLAEVAAAVGACLAFLLLVAGARMLEARLGIFDADATAQGRDFGE